MDLGRWDHVTGMSPGYDTVAGARELKLKSAVLQKWQRGWRPVTAGLVPRTLPQAASNLQTVAHLTRATCHWYRAGIRTLCRKWACGSPDDPVPNAVFQSIVPVAVSCPYCLDAAKKLAAADTPRTAAQLFGVYRHSESESADSDRDL